MNHASKREERIGRTSGLLAMALVILSLAAPIVSAQELDRPDARAAGAAIREAREQPTLLPGAPLFHSSVPLAIATNPTLSLGVQALAAGNHDTTRTRRRVIGAIAGGLIGAVVGGVMGNAYRLDHAPPCGISPGGGCFRDGYDQSSDYQLAGIAIGGVTGALIGALVAR
jgi:hypothetical protein